MENVVFTQLSIPEVRQLFRQELKAFFAENLTTSSTNEQDKHLTIQEAAAHLKVAVATVYAWVGAQTIPHFKKGRRLYFSKADLNDWVQSGRKQTVSEIQKEAVLSVGATKRKG